MRALALMLVASFLLSAGPAKAQGYKLGDRLAPGKGTAASAFREAKWEELTPPGWDPMKNFKGLDFNLLDDADPRAMEVLDKLREEWNNAPANSALNGTRIRIPGFLVPLERNRNDVTEFLLVPYFGACIHTPPPPANQVIHVVPARPVRNIRSMDPVWVNGVIETGRSDTGMGVASYRMKAELVAPYKRN
jgi:hypothetical protein